MRIKVRDLLLMVLVISSFYSFVVKSSSYISEYTQSRYGRANREKQNLANAMNLYSCFFEDESPQKIFEPIVAPPNGIASVDKDTLTALVQRGGLAFMPHQRILSLIKTLPHTRDDDSCQKAYNLGVYKSRLTPKPEIKSGFAFSRFIHKIYWLTGNLLHSHNLQNNSTLKYLHSLIFKMPGVAAVHNQKLKEAVKVQKHLYSAFEMVQLDYSEDISSDCIKHISRRDLDAIYDNGYLSFVPDHMIMAEVKKITLVDSDNSVKVKDEISSIFNRYGGEDVKVKPSYYLMTFIDELL